MTIDPRVARTREVVLAATIAELTAVGFERVSIDAIAERSGVARSTIYRNWPDRTALLAEAFRGIGGEGPGHLPPGDDLADDLAALGHYLVEKLNSEDWIRVVPSLIGAAGVDPDLREEMAHFSSQRRQEATAMIARAVDRGEIDPPPQPDLVMERFVGPFFFRALMSKQPLNDEFIAAQVAATLRDLSS